jgi:tRNA-2-methylthio-N6-dimethylallyladenosine synthase
MSASINTKRRFHLETFGCQMNVNDSEKIAGLMLASGYERVDEASSADFAFVNTCAVREKSTEKLYSALGRLKRIRAERPGMKIGVGGCVAQLHGTEILQRVPGLDVLVGTHNVARIPELLDRSRLEGGTQVDLDRSADSFRVPDASVAHSSPVRAYVTAMEGCNHVCSFCVVPRTRGTEVCRDPAAILAEVESLVARGYPEVMLLGQTVNAYRCGGLDFAGLLERVSTVDGLRRLRFTTSHPSHVDVRLADAMALPRVCPYLHLPVQSGSDRILESMRRGYTADQYVETAALLRSRVRGLALSSDVIVGYPGETEADFQATLDLVDAVGFDGLFVFLYSPRPGTTALRLEDDVPEAEKKRRFQVLNQRQQRAQAQANAARVGTVQAVLVDSVAEEDGQVSGRTPDFRIVHFEGSGDLLRREAQVRIERSGPNALVGRLVSANDSLTQVSAVPIF